MKATINVGKLTVIVYENGSVVVQSNTTRYEAGDGYFELRGVGGLIASEGVQDGRIVGSLVRTETAQKRPIATETNVNEQRT